MEQYLKRFTTNEEYEDYMKNNPLFPNTSLVLETGEVHYNPQYPVAQIGWVCYYDNKYEILRFCSLSDYNTSKGVAVGVVAVPNNCTPDGTVRILALSGITSGGTISSSNNGMAWGPEGDTGLRNYTKVPTWGNTMGTTYGNNSYAYVPSDKFTSGTAAYGNASVKYYTTDYMCPPILTSFNLPNKKCTEEILSGGVNVNALTDFDGAGNTAALVALGSSYVAASACSKYHTVGIPEGSWYLPACGELVYILPKFTVINSVLSSLGAVQLGASSFYWSSSEYNSTSARYVGTNGGRVHGYNKSLAGYVRAFASVSLSPLSF